MVNLTISAVDIIPSTGKFIKVTACVFINIIQLLQQLCKNKDDCRMLITSIIHLLKKANCELWMEPLLDNTAGDRYSNAW
ncbi:hypothetical protein M422DRAFT_257494 [Sphaerobolus stellatus SS14]|uniref:Uncharacterized protein n=1 Tax=Sphaerobolus stellatus (strain SS14) TaxID=990650 RepID=A0A0C9VNL6_SPHS4|nr:hypothetical protein M422DRAFT_257494 [Sphaerobolus stellatus SS14]